MTTEERDRLGQVVYDAAYDWHVKERPTYPRPTAWERLTKSEQEVYRRIGEAVRAAVLEGSYVAALERLALADAAWVEAPLDLSFSGLGEYRLERERALIALRDQSEWQQRQEQQP